jgi:hypothetical protein
VFVKEKCEASYNKTCLHQIQRTVEHAFENIEISKKNKVCQHGESGGMTELANASVFHLRDPGSNLSKDRKYFHILTLSHSNLNL